MSKSLTKAIIATYLIVALVTFGRASADAERADRAAQIECRATGNDFCPGGFLPGANGLLAAVLWPLYWSWVAFE